MVTKLCQLSIQTLKGAEEQLCTEKLEQQILYTSSLHVLTVFQQLLYSNIYNLSLYSVLCFIIKRVHKLQLPLQNKLLCVISHVQHKAYLEKQFVFIFPLLNQYFKYLWKPYTSLANHHLQSERKRTDNTNPATYSKSSAYDRLLLRELHFFRL